MSLHFRVVIVCILCAAALLLAQTRKFGVTVQSGPMDSILLKDYNPESSLVVPERTVAKARFPAVDVHSHPLMEGIRTPQDVAAWVRIMDEVGIETSVVFTGATGDAAVCARAAWPRSGASPRAPRRTGRRPSPRPHRRRARPPRCPAGRFAGRRPRLSAARGHGTGALLSQGRARRRRADR